LFEPLHRAPAEFCVNSFRRPGEQPKRVDAILARKILDEAHEGARMTAPTHAAIDDDGGEPRRPLRPALEVMLDDRGRAGGSVGLEQHKGARQPARAPHRREQVLRLFKAFAGIGPEFLVRPFGDDRQQIRTVSQGNDRFGHAARLQADLFPG
jgi:hypothetical protein